MGFCGLCEVEAAFMVHNHSTSKDFKLASLKNVYSTAF